MARISKPGLDYFPLDVNFLQDRKVRRISSRHHAAGIAALTSLLCLIYKEKGYYVVWNKDTLFDIAQEACCGEEEMQAIIDDCLSVGLFDTYIYKEYGVLTSQAIQEQYHKIITDSRRKYKLPLELFWLISAENEEDSGESAANTGEIATTIPQTKQETDRDMKGKREMDREKEIKMETEKGKEKEYEREKKKERETEKQEKAEKQMESEIPPAARNGVAQAAPVDVGGLSLGGSSESLLRMNLETIGVHNEQTVKAIIGLARRKELGGPGGTLWKILSSEYRSTLLKKNEPGDYILWALNHPAEFESTYNGVLMKRTRGRL